MLQSLFSTLIDSSAAGASRSQGAAFLQVARDLYRLSSLAYLCINLPVASRAGHHLHCCYSDTEIKTVIGKGRVDTAELDKQGLSRELIDWDAAEAASRHVLGATAASDLRLLTFPLPSRQAETAIFGISAQAEAREWETVKSEILREVRILADYLHNHVLRINGHNVDAAMLITARELDCLKWTAAGKTAWEASVILGISERTVRFHLNAAREKLGCATTTQAVAKAISHRLLEA